MADLSSSVGGLLADPNSAALMGLAQGLLAASAPSRLPVSMGQGLAMGLGGMQQGRQAALQQQGMGLQNQGAGIQNQTNAFNLARQKLMFQYLDGLLGGGQSQPAPQASQDALSAGVRANPNTVAPDGSQINMGGVGPTMGNAARMQAIQPPQQSSPYSQLIPPGMSPQTFGLMSLLYPQAASTVVGQQFTPTEQMKNAQFAAGGDGAAAQSLVHGVLAKEGMLTARPGGGFFNPTTGNLTVIPRLADGTVPIYNPQTGQFDGVSSVPGALQAEQQIQAAKASGSQAGKLAFTPQTVYNPQTGQMGQSLGGSLYGLGMGPNGMTSGAPGSAPGGFVPTAAPIGTNQATQSLAKDYANQGLQLPGIKNSLDGLSKALDLVDTGMVTGPGSEHKFDISGLLNTWHIPVGKDATSNYQLAYKYLANANNQAMGAMGMSGSDARMDQFLHGNPNSETMGPQALKSAIEYVRGQQAGVLANYSAKTAWVNAHGGNYTTLPQFNNAWGKAYNPNVMVLQQMDPAQGAAWLQANAPKGMSPDQFRAQIAKSAAAMAQLGAFQ